MSLRRYDATTLRRGQLLELNARGRRRRPGSADVLGGDGQVLPGQSHRPLVNRGVHLRGAVAQDAGHAVRVGIGLAQQARALVYRPGRVNNLTGRGRVPPCSGEAVRCAWRSAAAIVGSSAAACSNSRCCWRSGRLTALPRPSSRAVAS